MKETTGLQKLFPWSNPLKKASTLFNANTHCDWKKSVKVFCSLRIAWFWTRFLFNGMHETSGDGGQRGSQSLLGTYVGVLGVRNMSHSSSSVLWLLLGRVTEYWLVGRRMNGIGENGWSSSFLCSFTAPGRLSVPCCLRRLRNSWQFIFSSLNSTCHSFSSLHCSIRLFWSTLSFSMLVYHGFQKALTHYHDYSNYCVRFFINY